MKNKGFGALAVLLIAASGSAALAGDLPPIIPIPANSSLGPVPSVSGTGLAGQIWLPSTTGNLATNRAFAANNAANGTFRSTSVNYPRAGSNVDVSDTLANFLADDAPSVVGFNPTTTNAGPNLIRLTGALAFTSPGVFYVGVGSDDGFDLRIGNSDVGRFDGDRGFAYSYSRVEITQAGLYPIELFYWANGQGQSGLELSWDVDDNAFFDPVIVPTASLFIPAPGAVGLLGLASLAATRRRR